MPTVPAQPAPNGGPAKADEAIALHAECRRLTELVARQAQEFAALQASLEKKVGQRTAELERTASLLEAAHREMHDGFVATVEVFASLVQAGTRDTVSVRKIAELAQATAKSLGLSTEQQRDVHLAGLLCDLGKLTLHEQLIRTPVAAMTSEQAAEFKRHTLNAERILLPLKPLARVAAILRSHNERLDGLGYPDGLQGDAIPVEARVLHVVKDYDALLRKLLLTEALTPAEAVRYLSDHAGSRYDAEVVAAFLKILKSSKQDDNLRELRVSAEGLEPGMLVTRDLVNEHGVLMVPRGRRLDRQAINTLQRLAEGTEGFLLYVQR
jgi:response regulator RpfG family c-di-GMP phosphodiesterase